MADAAPKTTGSRIAAGPIKNSNVYNLAGQKLETVDDNRIGGNIGRATKAKSFLDLGEGPIRYPRTLPKSDRTRGG
ncbi:MAG: hypothetical protein IH626_13045 [Rhodospirillales bacterium]|nr:hypothetical protein [Rhodospirillales bacterium]